MNINRHNYEEFFLLYVDNELTAAERKAVDVFVWKNPDLQPELMLLQQTIVKAENIILDKKEGLYKEEEISALQENLLLYADDELMPEDKESVEALLSTDVSAMAEWEILKQTKLEADTAVVFMDKRSLYRTESGRLPGIYQMGSSWRRIAAAAVLLGFGIWAGVSLYKNNFQSNAGIQEIVATGKQNPDQLISTLPAHADVKKDQPDKNSDSRETAVETTENAQREIATENNSLSVVKTGQQKVEDQNNDVTAQNISRKKPDNNLPKPYLENINNDKRNKINVEGVLPQNNTNAIASGADNEIVKNRMNEKIRNSVITGLASESREKVTTAAIPVVYDNTDDGNNNDRILYMDEEKAKRTLLGGFLRKAKRMLERNTNIKTGDGLKIAGFEIALK